MKREKGYVYAYRRAWNDPHFMDFLDAAVWNYIYQNAVHEPEGRSVRFNGMTIHVQRGQLFTSLSFLATGFRTTVKVIRGILNRAHEGHMLGMSGGKHGTLLTVCNYDVYQPIEAVEGKRRAHVGQHQGNNTKEESKKEDREPYGSLVAGDADDGRKGRKPDPAAERQWLGTDDALPGQVPLPGMAELPVAREPVTVPEPEPTEQPAPEIQHPEPAPPDPTVMQAPAPRAEQVPAVATLAGEVVTMPTGGRKPRATDFEEFYRAYPRKGAKDRAAREYDRARRAGVSHAELMHALGQLLAGLEAGIINPQYRYLACNWIKDGHWRDIADQLTDRALPNGYNHDNPRAFAERRYTANGKPPSGANALALIRAELAARRA